MYVWFANPTWKVNKNGNCVCTLITLCMLIKLTLVIGIFNKLNVVIISIVFKESGIEWPTFNNKKFFEVYETKTSWQYRKKVLSYHDIHLPNFTGASRQKVIFMKSKICHKNGCFTVSIEKTTSLQYCWFIIDSTLDWSLWVFLVRGHRTRAL